MQHESREDTRASLLSLFQQRPIQKEEQPESVTHPTGALPSESQPVSNPKNIEELFRNINLHPTNPVEATPPPPVIPPPSADPATSGTSNTDKQNALLSLLGTVGVGGTPPREQRVPSVEDAQSGSEAQGKALLDSLVAGGSAKSSPLPPPTGSVDSDNQATQQSRQEPRKSLFEFVSPFDAFSGPPSPPTMSSSQPPSQSNTSATGPNMAKKKPVPAYNPSPTLVPAYMQSPHGSPKPQNTGYQGLSSPNVPSKNGSVSESDPYSDFNRALIDLGPTFTAPPPHGPLPPVPAAASGSNHSGGNRASPSQQRLLSQQQPSPPMRPPHPPPHQQSPPPPQQSFPVQAQPPQQQVQQGNRGRGSPITQNRGNNRDGASSPNGGPKRTSVSKIQSQMQGFQPSQKGRTSNVSSPVPQGHQLITVDVLSPLQSTQASSSIAQVTPIALLKLEPTYIQGTTIGVAGFIAYSMTRGRVRLIGRQSGARAMLRLPATFPPNASVQDMVINGTKLACVTNDGGLVVWDVPGEIEDDVQSRIFVHVLPSPDISAFKTVKWHPKQPNILAVASEREIYLLNVDEAMQVFGGEGIRQDELGRISKVFTIMSPLVSFTFDVPQIALASVSVDSTVTLWSMHDQTPFWSGRILGEGIPSSIDFLDGGLVVGRRQGNVLQFVPVMSTTVVSTIRFVLGTRDSSGKDSGIEKDATKRAEDEDLMFGHLTYDPTMKTLWVANSARSSLFAMKMGVEALPPAHGQDTGMPTLRPNIDQILEFPCSMPSINLTIVASDPPAPPGTSPDAIASWAKDPSLAVSAFCVHAGGVDQINIDLDAFESALINAPAKFPNLSYEPAPFGKEDRRTSTQSQSSFTHGPPPAFTSSSQVRNDPYIQPQLPLQAPPLASPERYAGMMPHDSIQAAIQSSQSVPAPYQGKGKGKETAAATNSNGGKPVVKTTVPVAGNGGDAFMDNTVPSNLAKEIKKVEDSLHTKIGRLIVKELDKQQSRLEEVRLADQSADFERQEKILKLISTELTKNTTRVVEQAVKSVVQNSVLPALENVTKNEIKLAMNTQISKGISESVRQSLPAEIERVLLRAEVSSTIARSMASTVVPLIERQVKDLISKNLLPAYTEAASSMNQDIIHELRSEILSIKKDFTSWQNESLKGTENLIRDMDQTIRSLADQVKVLSAQVAAVNSTPAPSEYSMMRPSNPPSTTSSFTSFPSYHPPPNPPVSVPAWMNTHPTPSHSMPASNVQPQPQPQPQPQSQPQSTPQATTSSIRTEDWDEMFLANLGQQDPKKLRELLQKCQPDVIMPGGGQASPLSQAVILTLIHRLAMSLTELAPVDDAFKMSMWWLQRATYSLNPNDNVIAPYLGRVLQTAVASLNTTTQRLNLLPGGPSLAETNNTLGQIQQTLSSLTT